MEEKKVETASFALFGGLTGVLRTRVGYCGGKKDEPTYHDLLDHSESVEIDFDPEKITYQKLLDVFFFSHDVTRKSYRSAIFYHNDEQKDAAEKYMAAWEAKKKKTVHTSIEPFIKFWLAEDYHQKYQLQQHKKLVKAMGKFSSLEQFVNSYIATKLNGVCGGHINVDQWELEKEKFTGLGEEANLYISDLIKRKKGF